MAGIAQKMEQEAMARLMPALLRALADGMETPTGTSAETAVATTAGASAGMSAGMTENMLRPDGTDAVLAPHLANVMRRVREVVREMASISLRAGDADWPLGNAIAAARNRAADIRSVAYLGKVGSHSNRSAAAQYPGAALLPVVSFAEACACVMEGRTDAAVLPIDNSTAGTIGEVYDLLLRHELFIVRGASLSIRNVLLGVAGSRLETVREVWTHPQPIAQCASFLRTHGLKAVARESTAAAAEAVALHGDPSVAAIGSPEAAALYGLHVLAEGIDDTEVNQTRFVTVMRQLRIPADADRVTLVFTLPNESGALSAVLARLADYGLNLVKIQSRPIPHRPWEYSFHCDFESPADNRPALEALYLLDHELPWMKLLGWYPEGEPK